MDTVARLGIPSGIMLGQLKAGKAVTLSNGSVVQPSDVLEPPRPARKLLHLGILVIAGMQLQLPNTPIGLCMNPLLMMPWRRMLFPEGTVPLVWRELSLLNWKRKSCCSLTSGADSEFQAPHIC